MGNLGWYQIMTTAAKKVGGPQKLIGIIFGGGALFGGGAVLGGKAIKNGINKRLEKKNHEEEIAAIYTINKECTSKEGLVFDEGMQFKVLERDGDAALIEILNYENNPYFVSAIFLQSISDYKF